MALIVDDGVEGFSMRRLAARLGVTPMAIYRHVADKRALEVLLARRISDEYYRDMDFPAEAAWDELIRRAIQMRSDLLQRRPELAKFGGLVLAADWNLRVTDLVLSKLLEAGASETEAARILRLAQLTLTGADADYRTRHGGEVWFGPDVEQYPAFARVRASIPPTILDTDDTVEFLIAVIRTYLERGRGLA